MLPRTAHIGERDVAEAVLSVRGSRPGNAPPSAWYALAILILVMLFALVDRQVLVLIADPLRKSLGLSDAQFGTVQGVGFGLFLGIAAFPAGWMGDRFGRRRVIAVSILLWSLAVVACGMARTFSGLLISVIFIGIGEAGLAPSIYGMIPELFVDKQRVLANVIFAVGSHLAGAASYVLCGSLIQWISLHNEFFPVALKTLEVWRLTFFALAIPGPVVIVLLATVRRRGAARPVSTGPETGMGSSASPSFLRLYLHKHWLLLVRFFAAIGLMQLGYFVVITWVPVIAARVYGATPASVGGGMALARGLGLLGGLLFGGLYMKRTLKKLGDVAALRVIWIGTMIAVLPALALPWVTNTVQLYVVTGLQMAAMTIGVICFPTVVQDMAPNAIRSRVLAIGMIVTVVVQSVGPILVGALSDRLSDVGDALTVAVTVVGSVSLIAGVLMLRPVEGEFSILPYKDT